MFKSLKNWVASRIQSKKFTVWLVGVVLAITAKYGWDLSPETVTDIIKWITATYLGAQGVADFHENKK